MTRNAIFVSSIVVILVFDAVHCRSETDLEKRFPNPLHLYAMKSAARLPHDEYINIITRSLERLRTRDRRDHRHMTDAGYGSRVAASSNLALSQIARHGLFGIHGPGRRKRTSTASPST